MAANIAKILSSLILISLSLYTTLAFATYPLPYQHLQLADGSMEMNYSQSDGSKVQQIQKPDGTVTVEMADDKGNRTFTTMHPDGTSETQKISS